MTTQEQQPRRSHRQPLSCEVEFRRRGGNPYRVELVDLSREGCRLKPPIQLDPGDPAWLRIPEMEAIAAHIVWAKEWDVGLEFDHPFHPAVLDLVIERLSQ